MSRKLSLEFRRNLTFADPWELPLKKQQFRQNSGLYDKMLKYPL